MNAAPAATRASAGSATTINLLPQSIRLRAVIRRRSRTWMAVLSVTAAAVLAAGQWSWQVTRDAAAQRKALLTQRVRMRESQRAAAAAQLRHDALLREERALLHLRTRDSCAALLLAIAEAVPDEAVLRRVQWQAAAAVPSQRAPTSAPAGPPPVETSVRIEGYAASYEAVTRLLERLSSGGAFREVRLAGSGDEGLQGARVTSFAVVVRR
ncbi:Fimbrial assembly protein (PilN) [Phycisphaerae bacterium RAS1]|nr:Fimbrial assembly protein (PilN) [Phycisphaerae bacterium RAS1]